MRQTNCALRSDSQWIINRPRQEENDMPRRKVSIIGAGNVGATAAYYIAEKVIADIVMVDVAGGMTRAKALDFLHAGPMRGYDVSIAGTDDFSAIADSDLAVITAGLPRKPGMDRMDLLRVNADIVKSAAKHIAEYAPNATVIVVSNPLDVMCHVAQLFGSLFIGAFKGQPAIVRTGPQV